MAILAYLPISSKAIKYLEFIKLLFAWLYYNSLIRQLAKSFYLY